MIGYKKNSVQRWFLEGHNVHGHAEIATALAKWLKDWEVGIRTPKSENPLVKTLGTAIRGLRVDPKAPTTLTLLLGKYASCTSTYGITFTAGPLTMAFIPFAEQHRGVGYYKTTQHQNLLARQLHNCCTPRVKGNNDQHIQGCATGVDWDVWDEEAGAWVGSNKSLKQVTPSWIQQRDAEMRALTQSRLNALADSNTEDEA